MTSFNLNFLLKALFLNTFTLGIKALTYELAGGGDGGIIHSIAFYPWPYQGYSYLYHKKRTFSQPNSPQVRTGHGTTDWFQIRKGVRQGCILSPCLFNLHAEYIMRNAGPDEAQAGIKIAGRNNNNLGYADDTTLMAESKRN